MNQSEFLNDVFGDFGSLRYFDKFFFNEELSASSLLGVKILDMKKQPCFDFMQDTFLNIFYDLQKVRLCYQWMNHEGNHVRFP